MPNFRQCCICGMSLPMNYLIPIIVNHQGRKVKVLICDSCRKRKEQEAKENNERKNI